MAGETVLVVDDSPTIRKVVELVLAKAGFVVLTAPDGEAGVEVARATCPDMILLDFVMPKMNGYQFCRALAAEETIRDIPVVLMSAKGDEVGERFVKVMGIVDYLTKPFSPDAIVAVVQHTVGKYGSRRPAEHTQPLLRGANEITEVGADPVGRASADAHVRALEILRKGVASAVSVRLLDMASDANETAWVSAAMEALDDDYLHTLLADAGPSLLVRGDERPALEGDLRDVPLAQVLQLLSAQSSSGVLTLSRARASAEVFFREGRVDLAAAAGVSEELLLGRFIVENRLMSESDMEAFLQSRSGSKLLGAQLVKMGRISSTDLRRAIEDQTKQIIYEALRWRFGRFSFVTSHELPALAVDASLGLEVEGILLEGFRRVDEWHLIEREIDNFDLVFLRDDDAVGRVTAGQLSREELAVLELVNGKHTVKDIVRLSRMGSFDVSKMLYRLLSIKLLRRRVMPVAV